MQKLYWIAVRLAGFAAVSTVLWVVIAAQGGKYGLWDPLAGFSSVYQYAGLPGTGRGFVLPLTLGIGLITLALGVANLFNEKTRPYVKPGGIIAATLAIIVGALPMYMAHMAQNSDNAVPPIHDITTNTANPPQFSRTLVDARGPASNSVDYASKIDPRSKRSLPEVQAEAYPQIQPLNVEFEPELVYRTCLEIADELGWDIQYTDPNNLWLEATATSFWFGFKDDVIVQLSVLETGAVRVDLRSVSRVGVSDLGANAKRIAHFLDRLETRLDES